MHFRKYIVLIFFVIGSSLFAQENNEEEEYKNYLISSLDSSFNHNSIVLNIRDKKIYEALPKLERNFWYRDCDEQSFYISALYYLNSDKAYEFTKAYLDSLDNSKSEKYSHCNYLARKVEVLEYLYLMNDYSRVKEVFELLDEYKQENLISSEAIKLIPAIYKNVPEYRQRAKEELLYALNNEKDDYILFRIVVDASQIFGLEELDKMIEIFKESTSSQIKKAILNMYFSNFIDSFDLRALLRDEIVKERSSTLRLFYIKVMLLGFSTISDYEFVREYSKTNPQDSNIVLIKHELKSFIPSPVDSLVSIETMLDTLISYTKQCRGYDWITDEETYEELLETLYDMKEQMDELDGADDLVESISEFIEDVEEGKTKNYITEEGYKFLYYYGSYIKDRLEQLGGEEGDDSTKSKESEK